MNYVLIIFIQFSYTSRILIRLVWKLSLYPIYLHCYCTTCVSLRTKWINVKVQVCGTWLEDRSQDSTRFEKRADKALRWHALRKYTAKSRQDRIRRGERGATSDRLFYGFARFHDIEHNFSCCLLFFVLVLPPF